MQRLKTEACVVQDRALKKRWPAGIVLTAEETHPRGGYGSMALAHDAPTVAALASVFHDAVVEECGKELQMRLWRLTGNLRTVDGRPSESGTFAVRPHPRVQSSLSANTFSGCVGRIM